ncbi:MAG: hypothetical protein QG657_4053 [Acidobacteriota bacterium]|nr:hypothetical protein [Acidobacteriota bacterium]
MDKLKQYLTYAAAVPVFILILGFGIGSFRTMPEYALLLVCDETKEYFAPPCLMEYGYDDIKAIYQFGRQKNLRVASKKEVRIPYRPNSECRENSGYIQDGRSLSGMLLEKIGLLPKENSRWNPDGSWNF